MLATPVAEIGGQLQVALGGFVDAEIGVDRLHDQVGQMRRVVQSMPLDESDQSAGGAHLSSGPVEPERAQVDHPELATEQFVVAVQVEVPIRVAVEHQVRPLRQHPLGRRPWIEQALLHDQLARCQALHVVAQPELGLVGGQPGGAQLPGRQIRPGKRQCRAAVGQRRQVIVAGVVEQALVHDRSRRDHLDDAPLGETARGKSYLFADRHLAAGSQQLRQIGLRCVMRHPAHRHAIALGQSDVEDRRRLFGVLGEHLVEVAEPKEKDRPRLRRLQTKVLPHHGGPLAHPLTRGGAPGSPAGSTPPQRGLPGPDLSCGPYDGGVRPLPSPRGW